MVLSAPTIGIDHLQLYAPELGVLATAAVGDSAAADALDRAFLEIVRTLPFGPVFTFAEQYGGALVHDVRPVAGHEQERSSRGRAVLQLHTDDAFLLAEARPEFMALLGVQNPGAVPTQLVRIDDVAAALPADAIDVLSQPRFTFARPASFDMDAGAQQPMRPILSAGGSGLEVAYATRTEVGAPGDGDAHRCLNRFREAVDAAPRRAVELAPGEILVFSNLRCLHGRREVLAERWLKRVYLRRDRSVLDGRSATGRPSVYTASAVIDR